MNFVGSIPIAPHCNHLKYLIYFEEHKLMIFLRVLHYYFFFFTDNKNILVVCTNSLIENVINFPYKNLVLNWIFSTAKFSIQRTNGFERQNKLVLIKYSKKNRLYISHTVKNSMKFSLLATTINDTVDLFK